MHNNCIFPILYGSCIAYFVLLIPLYPHILNRVIIYPIILSIRIQRRNLNFTELFLCNKKLLIWMFASFLEQTKCSTFLNNNCVSQFPKLSNLSL